MRGHSANLGRLVWVWVNPSRSHVLHESKFPFVSRIEFIRSKLSNFSAHVYGVSVSVHTTHRFPWQPRSPGKLPQYLFCGAITICRLSAGRRNCASSSCLIRRRTSCVSCCAISSLPARPDPARRSVGGRIRQLTRGHL